MHEVELRPRGGIADRGDGLTHPRGAPAVAELGDDALLVGRTATPARAVAAAEALPAVADRRELLLHRLRQARVLVDDGDVLTEELHPCPPRLLRRLAAEARRTEVRRLLLHVDVIGP